MEYYNYFPSPRVTAVAYTNKIRCRWPAVVPPPDSGSYFSSSVDNYRVYEGGNLNWICPICSRSYAQDNHPATCSNCHYTGSDWHWSISGDVTRSFVSGTEYTATDQVGMGKVVRVATHGYYCVGVPDDFWWTEEGWSEPVTIRKDMAGSYIPYSGSDVSLTEAANMIQESVYYGGFTNTFSLKNTTYNPNLNPFSRHLPGSQSLLITGSRGIQGEVLTSGTWNFSGSAVEARLLDFQGYADVYEYGCSGSKFYFPWGYLYFSENLDVHRGIVSAANLSGSFSYALYRDYAGIFTNSDMDTLYGRRMRDGVYTVLWEGRGKVNYSGLGQTTLFPGLILKPYPTTGSLESYIISATGSLAAAGIQTGTGTVTVATLDLPIAVVTSSASNQYRLYPVIIDNPVGGIRGSWTPLRSVAWGTNGLFTVDDCYLPISI